MGWFAKLLYKETDLISTIYDLDPCLKAIGFEVEMIDDVTINDVIFNRRKAKRGGLELTALWDGEMLTFLQTHQLANAPNVAKYQEFHGTNNYFTLTYGSLGHTLIVKHSMTMANGTPVVASSIQRVLLVWENYINIKYLL